MTGVQTCALPISLKKEVERLEEIDRQKETERQHGQKRQKSVR